VSDIILPFLFFAKINGKKTSIGANYDSDGSSIKKQKEKNDSIFNHVKPVVDIRYSQTGTIQTYIGVRLSF
jgi:hypothetical protein